MNILKIIQIKSIYDDELANACKIVKYVYMCRNSNLQNSAKTCKFDDLKMYIWVQIHTTSKIFKLNDIL